MDLATTYLGLKLQHPLMPGASPMTLNLEVVRRLEDAGAAAIVLPSLFEEQIIAEQLAMHYSVVTHTDSFAEALSYLPNPEGFDLGPHEYLEHVRRVKAATDLPVIASLNGVNVGRWLDYARQVEQAGADALELNVYYLATDSGLTAQHIEDRTIEVVETARRWLHIPIAVKLSPFYSSLSNFAARLESSGAEGLVLFNRFYQPDIDPEALDVHRVNLSNPSELPLRLRWLAILSSQRSLSLAATGGVHDALGAIKCLMAGAHAVQMVAALLRNGPNHLRKVRDDLTCWLTEHEYTSLSQLRGSMNLRNCPDPSAFERANYMQILQSWKGQP